MTTPNPRAAVLLLVVAHLACLATVGFTPLNLALAGAGLVAALTRGLLAPPKSVVPLLALPLLALPLLPQEVQASLPWGRAATPVLYRMIVLVSLEATLLSLFRWGRERQGWPVSAAVALTMAAGLTSDEWPYGAFVLVQMGLLAVQLRSRVPGPADLARLAPLPVAMALASVLAVVLYWSEHRVNEMMAWFTPPAPVSARFQAHSRLESMRDLQTSGRVVLRVLSPDPPLHLVGAVYDRFENDTWSQRSGLRAVPGAPGGADGLAGFGPVFRLAGGPGPRRDEYRLSSTEAGSLFVPAGATLLAARVATLRATRDGALQFEPDRGFEGTYGVLRGEAEVRPAGPDEGAPEGFLQLPADLPAVVRVEAARRAPGSHSPGEVARATEEWLQTGFRYGLGYPFAPGRSPLEQFLTERPPAHCEFFATAMTTMLRARGVPARYVTGFLVFERNAWGGFYTVRENHAHAWTEAWIPGRGWVTYDATPPGAATAGDPGLAGRFRQGIDVAAFFLQRLWARVRTGDWRGLLREGLEVLAGGLRLVRTHPGEVLGLAVLGLGAWWLRQRLRTRRPAPPEEAAPWVDPSPLPGLVEEFDRLLAGRGRPRPPSRTLLEFRQDLEELTPDEARAGRAFLEAWCRARYARDAQAEASLGTCLEEVRRAAGEAARGASGP